MIMLRVLEWGNYPVLSGQIQCNHNSPCHPREAEGPSKRREFGDRSRDWSNARAMS